MNISACTSKRPEPYRFTTFSISVENATRFRNFYFSVCTRREPQTSNVFVDFDTETSMETARGKEKRRILVSLTFNWLWAGNFVKFFWFRIRHRFFYVDWKSRTAIERWRLKRNLKIKVTLSRPRPIREPDAASYQIFDRRLNSQQPIVGLLRAIVLY